MRFVRHLAVADGPRRAAFRVEVLAEMSEQAVLAEATAALHVFARQHAACAHLQARRT